MSLPQAKTLARQLRAVATGANLLRVDSQTPQHTLYELWVALQALKDIRKTYDIALVNTKPKAQSELKFPLGPSNKKNYPYLEASKNGVCQFQICLGTKYSCATGATFAPDFSVQTHNSPLSPQANHVIFSWDCKFYEKPAKALPRKEITAFVGLTGKLLRPTAPVPRRSIFTQPHWPAGNAVLTNCKESELKASELQILDVSEVSSLRPRAKPQRRP